MKEHSTLSDKTSFRAVKYHVSFSKLRRLSFAVAVAMIVINAVAVAQLLPNAPLLRVMPLGDSITEGYPVPGGYRAMLYQLLINAGYNLDFVGTQTNNNVTSLPESNHEGWPGAEINPIIAGFTNWVDSVGAPDIILLLIGTNDYGYNYDTPEAIDRLDQLISEIVALCPNTRIVVANLLQRTDNANTDAAIQATFNPYVAGIVANHAALGQQVFFLDIRSALGPSDLSDGLHPNQSGYNKMATNWFGAVRKIIAPNVTNGQLVSFDGASINGSLNFTAIPANYQPIPGLKIGYNEVGIFNSGPDHTSGVTGTNHYNSYSMVGGAPQVFTFSKPVAIPSVWLTTYTGGPPGSNAVTVSAYSDAAGTVLLTNINVLTAVHPIGSNYVWTQFTGLAGVSNNIMSVQFASSGDAQVDDMQINANNFGSLLAIHLDLPLTNLYAGESFSEQANVTADSLFASKLNWIIDVTSNAGVVYISSDTNVFTVTTNGLVQPVGAGSATLTATLQPVSDSLSLTVLPGTLVDFNHDLGNIGKLVVIPASYQPIHGLTISYTGVGLFNGGPDHTTGILGGNDYNTTQITGAPQVFTFSTPVSIPSVWLATYNGSGNNITITVYSDPGGSNLLGTVLAPTANYAGVGNFVWEQCTNLDTPAFNGQIQCVEFSSPGNAQVDDLWVVVQSTNFPAMLTAVFSNGNMAIIWPTNNSAGATLMESPAIGLGAVWTAVGASPSVIGANYQMKVPLSGSNEFFRLQY